MFAVMVGIVSDAIAERMEDLKEGTSRVMERGAPAAAEPIRR
eukprot:SAG25_NODE_19_length_23408_cov_10.997040_12_plen_42_part_00